MTGAVWVLSVTPASAEVSTHSAASTIQVPAHDATATNLASTYSATGSHQMSCDYWRYY
ncbi:hypothetical protein H4696_003439 [Amycolatopsis lexingtonensis]|uniref:Uncharacterized protein n=1 Tax=Amycolatopsis lexingtonensis TaxID=218822 RepID=A0ABR9HZH8_9PSEU|nr:hypothetical protein [Amycolatopsis lexingtonensis]MBE1496339.1 hypothetical protein [Amycolatopsis lexingtonensis]